MDQLLYSLEGSLFLATAMRTAFALGHIRLFQSSLVPTSGTPLADFETAEADFDGYPSGGIITTTWNAPILDEAGGYSIGTPLVQFETDPAEATPNMIGGWFFVEAGGDLICFGKYGTPVPMQIPGQGLPISARLVFATGD